MLSFAKKYGKNIKYSQFGEEGILDEILKRINPQNQVCVEFGGHDGYFCSNTRRLIEEGWKGHMYDIEPKSDLVEKRTITTENINELPKCALLSIDVDNDDFWLWMAYTGKPDIVIIEINSSLPPLSLETPGNRGTGYKAMVRIGLAKGYFLLCHTANCVFVLNKHRKLFPEIVGDGISNFKEYFNTDHLPK